MSKVGFFVESTGEMEIYDQLSEVWRKISSLFSNTHASQNGSLLKPL